MVILWVYVFLTHLILQTYQAGSSTQGGVAGELSFIFQDTTTDFSSTQSIKIEFPTDFNVQTSDSITCEFKSATTGCTIPSNNQITVNTNSPDAHTVSIKIIGLKNPIFESGSYLFKFSFMDAVSGGGSPVFGSFDYTKNGLTFTPPDFSTAQMTFSSNKVFTKGDLSVQLKHPYKVTAGSKLEIKMPLIRERSGVKTHYIDTQPIVCANIAGMATSMGCVYDNSAQKLTLTNGFNVDIPANTAFSFKIQNTNSPPTTSPISSFEIYLSNNQNRKYGQKKVLDPLPQVSDHQTIPTLTVNPFKDIVGSSTIYKLQLAYNSPILLDTVFEFTFSNIDISAADVGLGQKTPIQRLPSGAPTTLKAVFKDSVIETNDLNQILILGIINNYRTETGELSLTLKDKNNFVYAKSASIPVNFQPSTIEESSIKPGASIHGEKTTVTLKFKTSVVYKNGVSFQIKTPNQFLKPSTGSIPCSSTSFSAITCTNNADTIALAVTTPGIAKGSEVEVKFQDWIMPFCSLNLKFDVMVKSGTFDVEKGSINHSTTNYTLKQMTIQPITSSSLTSTSPTDIQITFSHSVDLAIGSYIIIELPESSVFVNSVSQCDLASAGLESTAKCSAVNTTHLKITDGVKNSLRVSSQPAIAVKLNQIKNPRGLGSHQVQIKIFTQNDCLYLSAKQTLSVNSIPTLNNVAFSASNPYTNSYAVYNFDITPTALSIVDQDKIIVELPVKSSFALGPKFVCKKISQNLKLLTCKVSSSSKQILELSVEVDPAKYTASKKLQFSVEHIRNPDIAGDISGYKFSLASKMGIVYENLGPKSYRFENFPTIKDFSYEFLNKKIGDTGLQVLKMKLPVPLLEGMTLEFKYSSNFILDETKGQVSAISKDSRLLQTSNLKASPKSALKGVNKDTNTITFLLEDRLPPNSQFTLPFTSKNPKVTSISGPDLQISLFSADQKLLTKFSPLSEEITFNCNSHCSACQAVFDQCSECDSGFHLVSSKEKKDCLQLSTHKTQLPDWIFISIGLALFLVFAVFGLLCRCRNYWGNALYALFKLDFFAFGVYFGYVWFSNEVDKQIRFLGYVPFACHFLLSLTFFCFLRNQASGSNKYHKRYLNPVTTEKELEEASASMDDPKPYWFVDDIEKEYRCHFNVFSFLALIFGVPFLRWFYSERAKFKGFYWYFQPIFFAKIRNHFECYQIMYILVVISPFVAINIWFSSSMPFKEWNKYMIEALAMCALDLLLYLIAFFELYSSEKKSKELAKPDKEFYEQQEQRIKRLDSGLKDNQNPEESRVNLMDDTVLNNSKQNLFEPSSRSRQMSKLKEDDLSDPRSLKSVRSKKYPQVLLRESPIIFEFDTSKIPKKLSRRVQEPYTKISQLASVVIPPQGLKGMNKKNLRKPSAEGFVPLDEDLDIEPVREVMVSGKSQNNATPHQSILSGKSKSSKRDFGTIEDSNNIFNPDNNDEPPVREVASVSALSLKSNRSVVSNRSRISPEIYVSPGVKVDGIHSPLKEDPPVENALSNPENSVDSSTQNSRLVEIEDIPDLPNPSSSERSVEKAYYAESVKINLPKRKTSNQPNNNRPRKKSDYKNNLVLLEKYPSQSKKSLEVVLEEENETEYLKENKIFEAQDKHSKASENLSKPPPVSGVIRKAKGELSRVKDQNLEELQEHGTIYDSNPDISGGIKNPSPKSDALDPSMPPVKLKPMNVRPNELDCVKYEEYSVDSSAKKKSKLKGRGLQNDGASSREQIWLQDPSKEDLTMYLNLLMDESCSLDLNVEEMEEAVCIPRSKKEPTERSSLQDNSVLINSIRDVSPLKIDKFGKVNSLLPGDDIRACSVEEEESRGFIPPTRLAQLADKNILGNQAKKLTEPYRDRAPSRESDSLSQSKPFGGSHSISETKIDPNANRSASRRFERTKY